MAEEVRHGKLTINQGIHIPYQWIYLTAAIRQASTGFISSDVGKLARQLDDDSLWMLTATTPTWKQMGGGGDLSGLADVDLDVPPEDGQALVYNGTYDIWQPTYVYVPPAEWLGFPDNTTVGISWYPTTSLWWFRMTTENALFQVDCPANLHLIQAGGAAKDVILWAGNAMKFKTTPIGVSVFGGVSADGSHAPNENIYEASDGVEVKWRVNSDGFPGMPNSIEISGEATITANGTPQSLRSFTIPTEAALLATVDIVQTDDLTYETIGQSWQFAARRTNETPTSGPAVSVPAKTSEQDAGSFSAGVRNLSAGTLTATLLGNTPDGTSVLTLYYSTPAPTGSNPGTQAEIYWRVRFTGKNASDITV
jgi:hypothetical protein